MGVEYPDAECAVWRRPHHAAELRTVDTVEELNSVPENVRPQEIKLAKQVIDTFHAPLDLTTFRDEYVEGLEKIIEAKIEGEEVIAPATPEVAPLLWSI